MFKYAQINSDQVVFAVQTSTKEINHPNVIGVTEFPEIGSVWDGTNFNVVTPPSIPQVPLNNLVITSTDFRDGIHHLGKDANFTATADVMLPEGTYVLMAEKLIDSTHRVDDIRFEATVDNLGKLTLTGAFDNYGNYIIDPERINRGFARIGKNVELVFEPIEFNVVCKVI